MKDNKLIFLISQPRSGSSMLQQLILQSSEVVSKPEPWFMLSLIYTYKETLLSEEYNPNFAQINFKRYLDITENGFQKYKQLIKELSLSLYSLHFDKEKQYFLDKTPRYYHIVNELKELFPNAKFVFLSRNPVAVFSSILEYNFKGNFDFLKLKDRLHDLYLAIDIISAQKSSKSNNTYFVNYENIIGSSEIELKYLFEFLEIPLPYFIGKYKLDETFKTTDAVDKKSLKNHNKPVENYLNSWKKNIDTYQKKLLYLEYIQSLDENKLKILGYSKKNILHQIRDIKVKKTYFNYHLNDYLKFPNSIRLRMKKKIISLFYAKKDHTK